MWRSASAARVHEGSGSPHSPAKRPERIERDGGHLRRTISLSGVLSQIESIDLSHDSTTLVVGGSNGELIVVVVETGEVRVGHLDLLLKHGMKGRVMAKTSGKGAISAAFMLDDSKGTASATYSTVVVFDTSMRIPTRLATVMRPLGVTCIDVSVSGEMVAVGGRDKCIAVHSTSNGDEMFALDMTAYLFHHPIVVEFSNSGRWLAAGGDMRKAVVYDMNQQSFGGPLAVWDRGGHVNCLDFSADDTALAMGSSGDFLLTLVDTSTWQIFDEILQSKDVLSCAWAPDRSAIAAVSSNKTYLISVEAREIMAELKDESIRNDGEVGLKRHASYSVRGEFAHNDQLIMNGRTSLFFYDYVQSNDLLLPETKLFGSSRVSALALSSRGEWLAAGSGPKLKLVRLGGPTGVAMSQTVPLTDGVQGTVCALAFDDHHACTFAALFRDGHDSAAVVLISAAGDGDIAAVSVSAIFRLRLGGIAAVAKDPALPQTRTSSHLAIVAAAAGPDFALRWATDGSLLAVKSGHSVLLLDGRTLSPASATHTFGPKQWLLPIERIDGGSANARTFGRECFWDPPMAQRAFDQAVRDLGGKRIHSMTMSHDGRIFAAGGNCVLALFDTETHEAVHVQDNKGWVMGLAFSRDDRTLAIGSHDKTVMVLDVESNLVVHRCGERSYWPITLSFSADGLTLADAQSSVVVYRSSASAMSLLTPIDAAPMLRVRDPASRSRTDFHGGRAAAVATLLAKYPAVALNSLPPDEEDMQPLGQGDDHGCCRILDVLVSRSERQAVEEILSVLPALATLPGGRLQTPTFEMAIRLRDARTLRLLLIAAAKGPLPRRSLLATSLIPTIVNFKMGAAVCAFLKQLKLEDSSSSIKFACNHDGARSSQQAAGAVVRTNERNATLCAVCSRPAV